MKLTCCLAFLTLTLTSARADTTGNVFCDSNQNGQFDNGDSPVPSVLVVVTNTSGTYSNANWTGTPDGAFVIDLGNPTDTYVEYILPATLPSDAVIVQPAGGIYTFTPDANSAFSGNFLISSSTCTNGAPPPPPPPPATNGITCCLHGGGTIGGHPGRPTFVLAGSALSACGSTNGDSGEWEILSRSLRLHFQGTVMDIINCGQDLGASSNIFNFIEFQGAGVLKGIAGLHTNSGVVYFFAHAEDHGRHAHWKGTPDSFYFRVFGADDSTLMLIGGDASNPTNVVPVPLSAGRLTIGTNCCENVTEGDNDDDQGEPGPDAGRMHGGQGDHFGGANSEPVQNQPPGRGNHGSEPSGHSHNQAGNRGPGHGATGHSNNGQSGQHGQNDHGHGG